VVDGKTLTVTQSTDLIWRIENTMLKPNLVEAIKSSFPENANQLKHSVSLCQHCKKAYELAERMGANPEHNHALQCYQKILDSVTLLQFMMNDALTAAIALTDSESFWESRMHLKRLDVSAYEALNIIVGFEGANRQYSLFSSIDQAIDDLPESDQFLYAALKEGAATIVKRFGFNNAVRRNAFIHYRWKKKVWLIQTYDNITAISVPDALIKIIELKKLITEIVLFVNSFACALNKNQDRKFKEDIAQKFQSMRDIVNQCTNEEDKELGQKMMDDLQSKFLNSRFLRNYVNVKRR